MPEAQEHEEHHREDDFDQRHLEVGDGAGDEFRAHVDGDNFHARWQSWLNLMQLGLHAFNHLKRVLTLAHDDDAGDSFALAIEVAHAPAAVRAEDDLADVAHADGRAVLIREQHICDVRSGVEITAAAHHVFRAAEFHQPPAGFDIAAAHGLTDATDGDAVGAQAIGIHSDLELPAEAADGRDLRDTGHGLEVVAQIPILIRAQVGERVAAGFIHERVVENPPERRGIRPQLRAHALRQTRPHGGEVFLRAGPRPVQVRALLEDEIDVGVAEIGTAADGFHAGRAEHRGHDRIRDLRLDEIGAAIPARVNDNLRVAEVGDGVERALTQGPPARHAPGGDPREYRAPVFDQKSMMRLIPGGAGRPLKWSAAGAGFK